MDNAGSSCDEVGVFHATYRPFRALTDFTTSQSNIDCRPTESTITGLACNVLFDRYRQIYDTPPKRTAKQMSHQLEARTLCTNSKYPRDAQSSEETVGLVALRSES